MLRRASFTILILLSGALLAGFPHACNEEGGADEAIAHPPGSTLRSSPGFPVGIYYVAHYPQEQERRMADLLMIAEAGFDVIHTPIDLDDGRFLDACRAHGLSVIAEFNAAPEKLVARFGSHPALFAWASYDDVDAELFPGLRRYGADEVRGTNERLHAENPGVLTYISGGHPVRLEEYAGTSDMVAIQIYPIPFETLKTVYDTLTRIIPGLLSKGQFTLVNLQLFPWYGEHRSPTPDELRNMTYQAVAAGVNGIIYYTFYDEVTDLRRQPALWKTAAALAQEVKRHRSFFVEGSYCRLTSSHNQAVGGVWNRGGKHLVTVVNTGNEPITAKFSGCDVREVRKMQPQEAHMSVME